MQKLLTSETLVVNTVSERKEITENQMITLIQNYGDALLRLCTLYLKDRHLAEDAVQDTYIKVWKGYKFYQGVANEKTWITRIAINTCKNYMRSPWNRNVNTVDMSSLMGEKNLLYYKYSNDYEKLNTTLVLMDEIEKLKDKYRLVILLYYYEELSVKEIAQVLQKKTSTILSLLKRGRELLKNTLPENIMEVN